jgi:hypothetical protein
VTEPVASAEASAFHAQLTPPREAAAAMERTVFIVRLAPVEPDGSWRGEVEVVGGDERRGFSAPAELLDFITRRLAASAEGGPAK